MDFWHFSPFLSLHLPVDPQPSQVQWLEPIADWMSCNWISAHLSGNEAGELLNRVPLVKLAVAKSSVQPVAWCSWKKCPLWQEKLLQQCRGEAKAATVGRRCKQGRERHWAVAESGRSSPVASSLLWRPPWLSLAPPSTWSPPHSPPLLIHITALDPSSSDTLCCSLRSPAHWTGWLGSADLGGPVSRAQQRAAVRVGCAHALDWACADDRLHQSVAWLTQPARGRS